MSIAALPAGQSGQIGRVRARSLDGARRRSALIGRLKLALIAVIAGLALNVALQLLISGDSPLDRPMSAISGGERIVNPRFVGRDNTGQTYLVTAINAARRGASLQALADLEQPVLDYGMTDAGGAEAARMLANTGVFDETDQSLLLRENVELRTPSGYSFETRSALIRLNEGIISGEEGVRGEASWGAVRAGRFEVYDDTRRIVLEDDVRTRLYMHDTDRDTP